MQCEIPLDRKLLVQVSAPESSYNDDEEEQRAKGEDLLKHIGKSHKALPYRIISIVYRIYIV